MRIKIDDMKIKAHKAEDKAYSVADGGGFYLSIKNNASQFFILRYDFAKKSQQIHLRTISRDHIRKVFCYG